MDYPQLVLSIQENFSDITFHHCVQEPFIGING